MPESPAQTAAGGLTLRSLLLGMAVVVVVCLGTPFGNWVLGSSELTWSYFPIGVGFPFTCILFLHILLKSINRNWALRPAELITIVVMGLVVTRIPNFLCGYLLAIPTTPYYFTSVENQWGKYVVPNLPQWLLPSNAGQAMTWFFEGLPPGEPVPWSTLLAAWVPPLFWWLSFLWTLFFVTFCLVVILRKQWVERERLDFPLMEVPHALIADADGPARVPAILRTRLFWIGASVPLFVIFWNITGFFFHYVPQIAWDYPVQIARGFPSLNIRLYFPVIGFLYFAKLNVSFSLWFFFAVCLVEEGIFNRFGLGVTESDAFVWGLPSTSWQSWGAFVVMVLWGLWMARSHLKDVFLKAWNPRYPVDESRELLSYRVAAYGLVLGSIYMLLWLHRAGMSLPVAGLFLAGVLIAHLGITRLVIQAGVYYLTTPVVSQAMTMATLGTKAISSSGLATLGLCYSFFGDVQSLFMPSAAHAAKLHDAMRTTRRGLGLAVLLAVFLGFILALFFILFNAYDQGASNFNSWIYRVSSGAGVLTFDNVVAKIKNPVGPHLQKLGFFSGGALVMAVLTFMQYRFPWWPLHPIGLPIAAVWMIRNQVGAIFIAWAAKSVIIRFGGIDLYRRASPFFIGLILGHFLGVGISFIVDMIFFPGNGHAILHG